MFPHRYALNRYAGYEKRPVIFFRISVEFEIGKLNCVS